MEKCTRILFWCLVTGVGVFGVVLILWSSGAVVDPPTFLLSDIFDRYFDSDIDLAVGEIGSALVSGSVIAGLFLLIELRANEDSRKEDRAIADSAREQDRTIAEDARKQDREIAEAARTLDRQLALEARKQDRKLADRQALQLFIWSERDLNNRSFHRADMSELQLSGRSLHNTDLEWCDMTDCGLVKADLSGAKLFQAILNGIEGTECQFVAAEMEAVVMRKARFMRRSNFRKANLSYATFTDTRFIEASFEVANLTGTDFTGSTLEEEAFAGAHWDWDRKPIWPEGFCPPDNARPLEEEG